MAFDGLAAVSLVGAFVFSQSDDTAPATALLTTAIGAYLLGGPIVHAAHDHWGRAFGSLGLRLAMPLLTGVIAYAFIAPTNHDSGLSDASKAIFVGAILAGYAGAVAIDAGFLSYDNPAPARGASVLPSFTPIKNGASVGVVGFF